MSRKVALKDEDGVALKDEDDISGSDEEVQERFLIAALTFFSEELLGILQYKLVES